MKRADGVFLNNRGFSKPVWGHSLYGAVSGWWDTKEQAEHAYIDKLTKHPRFKKLLADKPYERQRAIVFGGRA